MRREYLLLCVVLMLVSACAPTNFLSPAQPTIAPQALTLASVASTPVASFTPTLTAEPTSTLTQTATIIPTLTTEPSPTAYVEPTLISKYSPYPQACYFNWARPERPDLNESIQAALKASGFAEVTVKASDYGENCISYETEKVQYFALMRTDFKLTIPIERTALTEINRQTFNLMTVFKDLWSDDNPIAKSSKMELIFMSESGDVTVLSDYHFLMGLLTQHPDGNNLLNNCILQETGPTSVRLTCRAN